MESVPVASQNHLRILGFRGDIAQRLHVTPPFPPCLSLDLSTDMTIPSLQELSPSHLTFESFFRLFPKLCTPGTFSSRLLTGRFEPFTPFFLPCYSV